MADIKPRRALEAIDFLREKGYDFPAPLRNYVLIEYRKNRGIKQAWSCRCCPPYESEVRITEYWCKNRQKAKLIWEAPRT